MKLSGMRGPVSAVWSFRVAVVWAARAKEVRLGSAAVAVAASRNRRRSIDFMDGRIRQG